MDWKKINSLSEYHSRQQWARENASLFWADIASGISWIKPYQRITRRLPTGVYRWFEGGTLNASYQCIDRHLATHGDKVAIQWIPESGEATAITYSDLQSQVNRLSNLLTSTLGIKKGDRVAIYMPMIPEAIYAMLACARIGAIHVIVFGGFSAEVLAERIKDTGASLVITADGAFRRGQPYMLKPIVDAALEELGTESCKTCLVVQRNNEPITLVSGRDIIYNDIINLQPNTFDPVGMRANDPLFILHTSGSTGKPKGLVHSTGGYLAWAMHTFKQTFNYQPADRFWSTADIGWITGHTYGVYGPLGCGATTIMYEGVPTHPNADRWWKIINDYRITSFYTSPTALRMLKKEDPDAPSRFNLTSLKILGSVGEPIDDSTLQWYKDKVGSTKCPVQDTWWQTETGGHLIAQVIHSDQAKYHRANLTLPGIRAEVLDIRGNAVNRGAKGLLCITSPWPGMAMSIWRDNKRFLASYLEQVPTSKNYPFIYFTGDEAIINNDNFIHITGRADDVMNISGHRIGSAEIESVLSSHELISEAAVVGRPDPITGEHLVAYVTTPRRHNSIDHKSLHNDVNTLLKRHIGPIVKLHRLVLVQNLPRTRSGKIVRRILRSIASDETITHDTSTLENPDVLNELLSATAN